MDYRKLMLLLYLADRKALLTWGRPITTDQYASTDQGIVLSRVLELITKEEGQNTVSEGLANRGVENFDSDSAI